MHDGNTRQKKKKRKESPLLKKRISVRGNGVEPGEERKNRLPWGEESILW